MTKIAFFHILTKQYIVNYAWFAPYKTTHQTFPRSAKLTSFVVKKQNPPTESSLLPQKKRLKQSQYSQEYFPKPANRTRIGTFGFIEAFV
ncbi:MAG: hypothetical protein A2275_03950 [Bacteroidetes bacterium RIFOXYA12_FULL_35_11]|nr:MAG: hypothetical protein A2X01_02890 [Bacteroidetes bacterium GWF2_35_48]OFY73444.1 MAG: hypothetical protein A2275_03950 [Bacteroidetes bacterium RIFOXYA12_FULL_35_11]OFY94085.1 MAG: hypothetical protein A2491_19220 [Bacteroidetes bacterium RIFOXYC12_FULL_35_7]HBX52348.1 hypothetical protein [Bacteroidales bacterium]